MGTKNFLVKQPPLKGKQKARLVKDYQYNLLVEKETRVPIVERYDVDEELPQRFIAFHEAMNPKETDFESIVHFYEDDHHFERLFNNPDKYLPRLKQFKYVITPDKSQYLEMPYHIRYANNCENKAMAQYLQQQGVHIIFNVTWSLPDSYDFSFAGIPHDAVIAINSNGAYAHTDSKYFWQRGYAEALKRLHPKLILRYGHKMPQECEEISLYYENEYLRRMRYGR